ncbi:MAG: DUF2892 domain-containing protein [Oligoflexia bacterium]|nr:DUF2892 domain-containing protein [Oligoflexia bacterium]MBF0365574.1 DUF2892 domain-containing protein [Oligoflexia bacterium]
MRREMIIRAMAGSFVTISTILGYYHTEYWYLLTLVVGLNLLQSAFTCFCPAEIFMKKLGIGRD